MSNRKALGPAIRALREALGVTQDSLALACDVSPSHISRVEAGKKDASEKTISAIAVRLGVSKDAITYPTVTADAA